MKDRNWKKRLIGLLCAVVLCFVTGCSGIENPAATPYGNDGFIGMNRSDANAAVREAGFTNITEEGVTPFIGEPGTVKSVTIDGEHSFLQGKTWENDVPVVITYYLEKEDAPTPEPESEPEKEPLEVTFDIEVTGEKGKPVFVIETNLPNNTELGLYLFGDNLYYDEQTAVVKDGKVESAPFTNDGVALTGYSTFGISMLPASQPESVQAIVGANGEYLAGPAVVVMDTYSYITTEKDFGEDQGATQKKKSKEDMKTTIESALATAFGDNYSVSLEDTVYTVNTWQDGLAVLAVLAQNGNKESLTTWEQIKQSTIDASESLQKLLENNGLGDYTVILNIVNDVNRENVLLTVTYGLVFYDSVSQ